MQQMIQFGPINATEKEEIMTVSGFAQTRLLGCSNLVLYEATTMLQIAEASVRLLMCHKDT
jgi:hypothetical protein